MKLTRRNMLLASTAAMAMASVTGLPAYASATDEAIAKVTGGAETVAGALTLNAPEIAENGNTVPIDVSAPGAVAVTVFADGNPVPAVCTIKFGPLNPTHAASTRIRLATTQNVIAIAEMQDGTFQRAQSEVKVTIGGCGG
jgi:sulfur-oxidizing protein SoxY